MKNSLYRGDKRRPQMEETPEEKMALFMVAALFKAAHIAAQTPYNPHGPSTTALAIQDAREFMKAAKDAGLTPPQ